jgi:hypothetical protein
MINDFVWCLESMIPIGESMTESGQAHTGIAIIISLIFLNK